MSKIKVRVWCGDEDEAEVITVDGRADPIAVINEYCENNYDNDWHDSVTVFLRGPNDNDPRSFVVSVKHEVTFAVKERLK